MTALTLEQTWPLKHLLKVQRSQPALVQRALDRLFSEESELRWSMVVSAYLDQEISLARAAALLEMHPLELRQQFIRKGIPFRIGPESISEAQAEVDALQSWISSEELNA